jgi:hypothetical protein
MPLSNAPCHSPLRQRARERGIAVGTSLTGKGYQTAASAFPVIIGSRIIRNMLLIAMKMQLWQRLDEFVKPSVRRIATI